jgi:hypothetical protein
MLSRPLPAVVLFFGILTQTVPAQTLPVYSDGLDHTANGTQSNVLITDSPAGVKTTVRFISPADVNNLRVEKTSVADLQSGRISQLDAFGYSKNSMSGGSLSTINLFDRSTFTLSGGTAGQINGIYGSNTTIQNGSAESLRIFDYSFGTVKGGNIANVAALGKFGAPETPVGNGNAWLFIEGGTITTARAGGGGVISILDGTVNIINPFALGTTNVFGGTIGGFLLNPNTTTNVYGYNLTLAGERLVGILADGSTINAQVSNAQNAALNIFNIPGAPNPVPIPEPASAVLLGMAFVGVGLVARRNRR